MNERVVEYFSTARERYRILQRRRALPDPPFTEDPIFREWRFCNVFKEDDRTTNWIRENVRWPLRHEARVVTAMVACRVVNRIETLEILLGRGLLDRWNTHQALAVLQGVHPVVGSAYVVNTPAGKDKAGGVVEMVNHVAGGVNSIAREILEMGTLQGACELLQRYPYLGPFMAYEVVSDLRHTDFLAGATDAMTWANPGPGACQGLQYLETGAVEGYSVWTSQRGRSNAVEMMQGLLAMSRLKPYWPTEWPQWEMREVEHWLCEYAKYSKAKLGHRLKRRFT